MLRNSLRAFWILGGGYLGLSFLLADLLDQNYRGELARRLRIMGREGYTHTSELAANLKEDAQFRRDRTLLDLTPPFGWIVLHHLDRIEDRVIYGSRNIALPEKARFADPGECRQLGFDPAQRTDADIAKVVFGDLR